MTQSPSSTPMGYKPNQYTSVAPYLVVEGASRTIEFLKAVFDATELSRIPNDSGQLTHAEVRLDDTVIMLGDNAEGWPAVPAHVHVYVPDVDVVYQKALDWGATPVQEPIQKDEADKRGGVKGPGGITWWIATKVD